jgi:hypothetical protein
VDIAGKKVTPGLRWQVVADLREHHGVSERRVWAPSGIDSSVMPYRPRRADDAAIRRRLRDSHMTGAALAVIVWACCWRGRARA